MRSGLAVVLLDGDVRVLGDRLLELGDARLKFLLVRGLLDGRLDEAGLLARVRRDEKDSEGAVADREAPADVAARAVGPPMWKSNFGRPTPSTRYFLRGCVCSMA